MNEYVLWILAKERLQSLREEARRLREVPRPKGFWAASLEKLFGRARARSTPAGSARRVEAACCEGGWSG